MTKLNIGWAIFMAFMCVTASNAQETATVSAKDFKTLVGSWQGALTYLDYSSGKPYTMPADVAVKRLKKTNTFILSNVYPNETNANSLDTLTISPDGKLIGTELVKSKKRLDNGDLEIVTEELGKDGNDDKPAILRHTYTVGKTIFKKRKDIQFQGETIWINRHEYSYKKKPSK